MKPPLMAMVVMSFWMGINASSPLKSSLALALTKCPLESQGVVPPAPGLDSIGLVFLTNVFSTPIGGMGNYARHTVKKFVARSLLHAQQAAAASR